MDRTRHVRLATRLAILCYVAGAGTAVVAARCILQPCALWPGDPLATFFRFAPGTFLLGATLMTLLASRERVLQVMLLLTLVLWLAELTGDGRAFQAYARIAYAAAILASASGWGLLHSASSLRGNPGTPHNTG